MEYSVYASTTYGIEITSWIDEEMIFSINDVFEEEFPDSINNALTEYNVSVEHTSADYMGTKVYLRADGWSGYAEPINARGFGSSLGTCSLPTAKDTTKMNNNLQAVINRHHDKLRN